MILSIDVRLVYLTFQNHLRTESQRHINRMSFNELSRNSGSNSKGQDAILPPLEAYLDPKLATPAIRDSMTISNNGSGTIHSWIALLTPQFLQEIAAI